MQPQRRPEDIVGMGLGCREGIRARRERLSDVGRSRRLPGAHDPKPEPAQLRLVEREAERRVGLGRAVDTRPP